MNTQQEIIRGQEAKQLLNNPIFQDAIESVREGIIKAIADSPMGDEKTHNRLAIALQLLQQVEKSIRMHIETGTMAQIQVDESVKSKLKRVFG